jgi:SnoaL-like domain
LVLHAAHLSDNGQWDELVELFTPDGELVRPSAAGTSFRGRETILASLRGGPSGTKRSVVSNLSVDVISETEAHVSCTATRYSSSIDTETGAAPIQQILVGHFQDELVMVDGRWAFRRRHGSMALQRKFEGV